MGSLGVGTCFFVSLLFTYNLSLNPFLWRVFDPKNYSILGQGNHHVLIMILFGFMFYATVAKGVNPLLTCIGMYFFVEAYEGEWYITYIISKYAYVGYFHLEYLTATILSIPIIIFYIRLFGVPWKFLAFMIPMYSIWLLLGFPITNDFTGFTKYFYDIPVNALEVMTHVIAAIGYLFYILPTLKAKSDKIHMDWATDFRPLVTFISRHIYASK